MDEHDTRVRNTTYRLFAELGRAPEPEEVARALGRTREEVLDRWRRLDAAHALSLDGHAERIRMANPFSALPTQHRVLAAGKVWFANCAWDAFGICAALQSDGEIHTTCPDCGDAIEVAVRNGEPDDETLLFHCLVPAARWWDDIGFA
ncbi:MAG TPA: organomercurial lyase [Actinomycetota bacterium]|jgi:hypothetical protein